MTTGAELAMSMLIAKLIAAGCGLTVAIAALLELLLSGFTPHFLRLALACGLCWLATYLIDRLDQRPGREPSRK